MPQMQLPIFPPGLEHINEHIGFEKRGGKVYYFHGMLPVFSHDEDDLDSFRFITSQIVVNGNAKQIEIVRAFGVSSISVKRYVKKFREHGGKGFFSKRKTRGAHVLTPEVITKAQTLLDQGDDVVSVAKQLVLKADTLRKAIRDGRLHKKKL